MPSAEDEERAVFDDDEDDDDDTDGDDSELEDDDDTEGDDDGAPPPQPPRKPAAAPGGDGDLNSAGRSASSDRTANPNPNPNPDPNPNPTAPAALPQNGAIQVFPLASAAPPGGDLKVEERRALATFDDSRRLFQRLWTDDDEITILKGFLEFTSQRGTTFASHQYDTGPFYEQIKKQIQLDFTKNQLIEKLRRLKKKFRNAACKLASGKEYVFKSPHDQTTFEISRKIWSVNLKRARDSDDDDLATPNHNTDTNNTNDGALSSDRRFSRSRRRIRQRIEETAVEVPVVGVAVEDSTKAILAPPTSAPIPNLVEETVRSCLGPLFKELLNSAIGVPCGPGLTAGGLALNALLPLGFRESSMNPPGLGAAADEKWRKQQILELEVYLKRIELLQDQIKSTLGELKSSLGS